MSTTTNPPPAPPAPPAAPAPAQGARVSERARSATSALSCPRCGGTPRPENGPGHLARCESCGVLGRIDDREGRHRLVVLPAVTPASSEDSVRVALEDKGLGRGFRVHRSETLFVPYWRMTRTLAGRVEGRRVRRSKHIERVYGDDGRPTFVRREVEDGEEDVRREVQKVLVSLLAGCPLEELGLPTLDARRQMTGKLGVARPFSRLGEVVVFHPDLRRHGTFLDPLVTLAAARDESDELARAYVEGLDGDLLPGAEVRIEELASSETLLYYPVHLVSYGIGERRGRAACDATTGALVSLRLPADEGEEAGRRAVALAALASGALAGSIMRLALFPPLVLAAPSMGPLRGRLFLAALVLGGGALAGLWSLLRQIRKGGQ